MDYEVLYRMCHGFRLTQKGDHFSVTFDQTTMIQLNLPKSMTYSIGVISDLTAALGALVSVWSDPSFRTDRRRNCRTQAA